MRAQSPISRYVAGDPFASTIPVSGSVNSPLRRQGGSILDCGPANVSNGRFASK